MLDTVISYVQTNLANLGVGAAAIAVIVFLIKQGYGMAVTYKDNIIQAVKDKIFALVNEVEQSVVGQGLGQLKKSKVFTEVMENLPTIVKLFISADDLNLWIDQKVLEMKLMLGTITQDEYNTELAKLSGDTSTTTDTTQSTEASTTTSSNISQEELTALINQAVASAVGSQNAQVDYKSANESNAG